MNKYSVLFLGREMVHRVDARLETGGRLRYCMLTILSALLAAVFVQCVCERTKESVTFAVIDAHVLK